MGGACLGSYMAQMYSTSHAIILLTLFLFFAFFHSFFYHSAAVCTDASAVAIRSHS